jgi:oligopeptide transport system ATP-binding protein
LEDYLLQVENLKTYFKTRAGYVHAVDGMNFAIKPGEKLAIVGESGCGKSVTSLSIMRLIPQPPGEYVEGRILFEGQDLLEMQESNLRKIRGGQISMIFQDPMTSLNPVLSVGYQISEAVKRHRKGTEDTQAWKRAVEMLDLVGIPDARRRAKSYPHEFSGGMRQRVMIAIALACNPKLLIADEPTTALDVTVQAQILELIGTICSEFGTALILITHDLGVVAGVADRVLVMYAGRVVEEGPTEELFGNPQHPYTIGLLSSVPRLDELRRAELKTIEGAPPDLLKPPAGCAFMPRCLFARTICNMKPPLQAMEDEPTHSKACWINVHDPRERAYADQRRLAKLIAQQKAAAAARTRTTQL